MWIAAYGWRTTYFYLAASALIIALPFVLGLVKSRPSDKGLKPYGAEKFETVNGAASQSATNVARGVTAAKALKSPAFYLAAITAGGLAIFGTFSVQMVAFAGSVGFDIAKAGSVMSFLMIGLVIGKVLYGWVNDKTGLVFSTVVFGLLGVAGLLLLLK
ncbi:MAG: MFS transporter, partial [Clostridiales bacterium]|nr:MFS transporter [Clostridiales bacterium]